MRAIGSGRGSERGATAKFCLELLTRVRGLTDATLTRFEYRVIDTGQNIEAQLNELGADGWKVVGVTTKKQLLIAPPAAIILMREVELAAARAA